MSIFEYNQEAHMESVRKEGYEDGIEVGKMNAMLASVQSLMQNLKLTPIQAMDALDVPQEDRAVIMEALGQVL